MKMKIIKNNWILLIMSYKWKDNQFMKLNAIYNKFKRKIVKMKIY